MLYLIATITIKPGSMEALMEAVKPCIEGTRNEPGNISYDLVQDVLEPTKLMFVERWENRASLENHFTEPHFLAWREANAAFITDKKLEIIENGEVEIR